MPPAPPPRQEAAGTDGDAEAVPIAAEPVAPWEGAPEEQPVPLKAAANGDEVAVSVEEAAALIKGTRPALVVVFSPGCSLSRAAFPQVVEIARGLDRRTTVLAFSTDTDAARVAEFLAANGATFPARGLQDWQPGQFASAMSGVGIHIGATWTKPLIAVIGDTGELVGEWQGSTDLRPVADAVRRAGI
jgi:hypothetical protein